MFISCCPFAVEEVHPLVVPVRQYLLGQAEVLTAVVEGIVAETGHTVGRDFAPAPTSATCCFAPRWLQVWEELLRSLRLWHGEQCRPAGHHEVHQVHIFGDLAAEWLLCRCPQSKGAESVHGQG